MPRVFFEIRDEMEIRIWGNRISRPGTTEWGAIESYWSIVDAARALLSKSLREETEALARDADVRSLMRSLAFSREEAESVVDQVDADSGLSP